MDEIRVYCIECGDLVISELNSKGVFLCPNCNNICAKVIE